MWWIVLSTNETALYSRVARMVDWEHRQTEDEDMLYLLLERFSWRCCYFSSVWATHIELGETLAFSKPRNGWYHICLQGWRRPTHNHWQPKQVDVIRRIGLADQDKVTKKIRIRSGQTLTNAFKRSQLITAACLFVSINIMACCRVLMWSSGITGRRCYRQLNRYNCNAIYNIFTNRFMEILISDSLQENPASWHQAWEFHWGADNLQICKPGMASFQRHLLTWLL